MSSLGLSLKIGHGDYIDSGDEAEEPYMEGDRVSKGSRISPN